MHLEVLISVLPSRRLLMVVSALGSLAYESLVRVLVRSHTGFTYPYLAHLELMCSFLWIISRIGSQTLAPVVCACASSFRTNFQG
jgi:hypothetical protein